MNKIKEARHRSGMTMVEFGKLIGLNGTDQSIKTGVNRLENGSRHVPDIIQMTLQNHGLWPLDREDVWVVGEGAGGTGEYLIRTARPRMIAELGSDSELTSGLSCALGFGEILHRIEWLDMPVNEDEMLAVLREAAEAVTRYSELD